MPKGPRKLAINFGNKNLTHYGGVYLLHRFLTRIGFKNAVAMEVRLAQRNNRYSVGELLLAIIYPIILGLERIETTHLLQANGVFQYLSGLSHYPNATTLRRFLLRMAPQALPRLRKLHDRFLARMSVKPRRPRRLIFDLDSTALIVYGKQEAADVGYHPFKPGRRSYHPLLCFEGTNEGLLARGTAPRSRLYWGRSARPAGSLFCQNSRWRQTGYYSRRQGFLRSQDHRLAGTKKGQLCDRCQADSGRQATALRLALPPSWRKRFDGPVLLPAIRIEKALSLCSSATTPNRRDQRATDSLQGGPLFLSSVRHQSYVATTESVALLQWPSGPGTNHPRTQRQLSLGQDSDASLRGQRGLLSSVAAGLQSGQLVQTALSARGVSKCYAWHFAQPDLLDASATVACRQPPQADYANQRAARECLEICIA